MKAFCPKGQIFFKITSPSNKCPIKNFGSQFYRTSLMSMFVSTESRPTSDKTLADPKLTGELKLQLNT